MTGYTTTGTNDFIFHIFLYKQYFENELSLFLTSTYILRGTNKIEQSFGDVFDISLYTGKSLTPDLSVIVQLKGENTEPLVDEIWISYEKNTGGKLLLFVPQLSYKIPAYHLTFTAAAAIPVYHYVNGTQIASKWLLRGGIIYRPFLKK